MACKDKYTELSNSFDDMVNKCIYTMVELKKRGIDVVKDDNSFFQVPGPKAENGKFCSGIVTKDFGGAFKAMPGKNPTDADLKLTEIYLARVRATKKYGRLLISYAESLDDFNKGKPNTLPIDAVINAMNELYEFTVNTPNEKKKKK